MGRRVNRGDVWLAQVGRKVRPVLVLTRSDVIDVRVMVTVAEVTTSRRGLATEVELDRDAVGLDRPSVVNTDGVHTVAQTRLTSYVGAVDDATMADVCWAVAWALGC